MAILAKVTTYWRLGLSNLLHVALYRLKIRHSAFQKLLPIDSSRQSGELPYFHVPKSQNTHKKVLPIRLNAFGWINIDQDQPPNWTKSVISDQAVKNNTVHWSDLSDFDLDVGDIKTVWELSRFHWLSIFAVNYLADNQEKHLQKLNLWLNDWCFHNPINQGVNWKCGQETSIRVMQLATTAFLLNQHKEISAPLVQLVHAHLCRIAPTIHYAMAQDNNHGTSEAAALYIGALLLKNADYRDKSQIQQWKQTGLYWLENRAAKLIDEDGAFSQHSTIYHRLMLDTLSLAEFFRQQFDQESFDPQFYQKAIKASYWLKLMVINDTGDTALLGLNDGAQLLPLTTNDFVDVRPSVQWSFNLFLGYSPYNEEADYHQLTALLPSKYQHVQHQELDKHQLTTSYRSISTDNAKCFIRTPNRKFRPSSCDALHIDFWHKEKNLLLSTGSYSYNCEPEYQNYFPSVRAHNCVQFDNKEQMPKLSRFLFSNWINVSTSQINSSQLTASYRNVYNHFHQRQLTLSSDALKIIDKVSGFERSAVVRWHLPNLSWQLDGHQLTCGQYTICVDSDVPITQIALVDGLQSRYYLKKEKIAVLEITIERAGTVSTLLSWH